MRITVFLASREGNDPRLRAALEELAAWIGDEGHALVWGGSGAGLMGALAAAAKAHGARLIGVEPRAFAEAGDAFPGADELLVEEDMDSRKRRLIALADAVVVFPGGAGTLEEFGQAFSMLCLGETDAPLVVYDAFGFYAPLRALLDGMQAQGFLGEGALEKVTFASSLSDVAAALASRGPSAASEA